MEKEAFYDTLTELKEAFPGRPIITRQEAARYLRMDIRTIAKDKTFPVKKTGGRYIVPLIPLARWMS